GRRRGTVANLPVGENRGANRRREAPKIGERRCALSEQGESGSLATKGLLERGGGIEQRGSVEQLGWRKHCAGSIEAREPHCRVGQRAESQLVAGAQVGHGLARQRERGFERSSFWSARQVIDPAAAGRTGGVSPQDLAQAIEFENLFSGTRPHASPRRFRGSLHPHCQSGSFSAQSVGSRGKRPPRPAWERHGSGGSWPRARTSWSPIPPHARGLGWAARMPPLRRAACRPSLLC